MDTVQLFPPPPHQYWLILGIEHTYHEYPDLKPIMVLTWLREDLHLVIPQGLTSPMYLRAEYDRLRWIFVNEIQSVLHPSRYQGFGDEVIETRILPNAVAIRFQL